MGVKNLWSILSSTAEAITIGFPGAGVLGSPNATHSKLDSELIYADTKSSDYVQTEDGIDALNLKLNSININDGTKNSTPFDISHSLAGKAVAIDLSCWVCDSQANANMHSVTKPHLR